jgi:hypothetical protein
MAAKAPIYTKQTTTSTGTGALTLATVTGFAKFTDTLSVNDTCIYGLFDADGLNWEFGLGTLTSTAPDIFTRDYVFKSTNADAAISLATGTHTLKGFGGQIDGNAAWIINHQPNSIDFNVSASTGTTAINLSGSLSQIPIVKINISANTTLTVSNYLWTAGNQYAELIMIVIQDATGGRVLTLPASFKKTGNSPALTTAANDINIIEAVTVDGGTNWIYTVK